MTSKQGDGSVESIYQRKTQLEHILLRPDTYIGSTEPTLKAMWVVDEKGKFVNKKINFVPGLYKIFDEILVNAADNKQRDPEMDLIKINIDVDKNTISIWNNGKGIPIVEHKDEKMYVPALIFGHLLTSSNYDDTEKRVVGGRHGYGAKLCNIFSSKFTVTTACKENNKKFEQTWTDNMTKTSPAVITEYNGPDFTEISFQPDLAKFELTNLNKDVVALLTRRAYDIAGVKRGVRVMLNGKEIPVSDFESYCKLYIQDKVDADDNPLHLVYEYSNDRWEIGLAMSNSGFQHVSFVNSISTSKGGTHVDYITKKISTDLVEKIKSKIETVKPHQVKSNLWVFINALIENPAFDSQTKESLTILPRKFGSKCKLSASFIKEITTSGILNNIQAHVKDRQVEIMDRKAKTGSKTNIDGIPKLHDANMAGTRYSQDCTLILTEGDSAKALAVSGLGIIGRDYYGVFPLRGKILNVRDATHKQIMENEEVNNIAKILGLQYRSKYETRASLKTLRYGKLMIMADQDNDGSHIKGLVINFIHANWPNLLKHNFVEVFITPIVKVTKGKKKQSFYSLPEYEEWKLNTPDWKKWKIKYYKGLGTSTTREGQEYFRDIEKHRIVFSYGGPEDDESLNLAFSKKNSAARREWLTNWLAQMKSRREAGLGETYLYRKDTKEVTFNDFVHKELVVFSNADNIRQIPSIMDGLKPSQRKILYTMFKKYEKKEVKVSQLGGAVSEATAYRHGEEYLMGSIVNMAQNFVGTNNINLLLPIGQFGTRLQGGKDSASPRYLFTRLNPLTRSIFPAMDDPLLTSQYEDNQVIEPQWYCPIIPMVLVNGCSGIGTGWNTRIFNHNVRDIVKNLKRMLNGKEPDPMMPFYKNFRGNIAELSNNRYQCSGEIGIFRDENIIEITELPIFTSTQDYQENVLETLIHGQDKLPKIPQNSIKKYQAHNTDTTVKFVVQMAKHQIMEHEYAGLHKFFKLTTTLTQNSTMILFDSNGNIKRYSSVEDILKEFFDVRLDMYQRRKDYIRGLLEAESCKLNNQSRFINEKIAGGIVLENQSNKEIAEQLVSRGYDSDPIQAYKANQVINKDKIHQDEEVIDDSEKMLAADGSDHDYRYLLRMQMWALTKEKVDKLNAQAKAKEKELNALTQKTPHKLWEDDLKVLMEELKIYEAVEGGEKKAIANIKQSQKAKNAKKTSKKKIAKKIESDNPVREETRPTPGAERIKPMINWAYLRQPGARKKAKENKGKQPVKVEEETPPEAIENTTLPAALTGSECVPTTEELGSNSLAATTQNTHTVCSTSNASTVRSYSMWAPSRSKVNFADYIRQDINRYSTNHPLLGSQKRHYSMWAIPQRHHTQHMINRTCRSSQLQNSVGAIPQNSYSVQTYPYRGCHILAIPHRQYRWCSVNSISNTGCISRLTSRFPEQSCKYSSSHSEHQQSRSVITTRQCKPLVNTTQHFISGGRLWQNHVTIRIVRFLQRFPIR